MIKYWIGFVSISLFFFSCTNQVENVDLGLDYFPIDTGRYYIYQCDSIIFDCEAGVNDTSSFQLKEYYESYITDASNNSATRIERWYRKDSTRTWSIIDVWSTNITNTRAEKVEENYRIVKMVFPVIEDYTWNGNQYNSLPAEDFEYTKPEVSYSNGILNFNHTVTVNHKLDTNNLIQYRWDAETFAKNIGMVDKLHYDLRLITTGVCSATITQPFNLVPKLKRIRDGRIIRQRLIEHGYE